MTTYTQILDAARSSPSIPAKRPGTSADRRKPSSTWPSRSPGRSSTPAAALGRRGEGRVHRAITVRGPARPEGLELQRGWAEGVVRGDPAGGVILWHRCHVIDSGATMMNAS